MKMVLLAAACTAALGIASTHGVNAQSRAPTDTGNMAYPAPLPQGNFSTYTTTGPNRPTDTGNMSYPAPLPQGNSGAAATTGPDRRPGRDGNAASR